MKNEMVVNKRTLEELQDLIRYAQKTSGRSLDETLMHAQSKCRLMLGMETNFTPQYNPEERLVQVVMPARIYEQLICASTMPFPKDENISAHRLKALVDFNAFHRDVSLSFELIPLENHAKNNAPSA